MTKSSKIIFFFCQESNIFRSDLGFLGSKIRTRETLRTERQVDGEEFQGVKSILELTQVREA